MQPSMSPGPPQWQASQPAFVRKLRSSLSNRSLNAELMPLDPDMPPPPPPSPPPFLRPQSRTNSRKERPSRKQHVNTVNGNFDAMPTENFAKTSEWNRLLNRKNSASSVSSSRTKESTSRLRARHSIPNEGIPLSRSNQATPQGGGIAEKGKGKAKDTTYHETRTPIQRHTTFVSSATSSLTTVESDVASPLTLVAASSSTIVEESPPRKVIKGHAGEGIPMPKPPATPSKPKRRLVNTTSSKILTSTPPTSPLRQPFVATQGTSRPPRLGMTRGQSFPSPKKPRTDTVLNAGAALRCKTPPVKPGVAHSKPDNNQPSGHRIPPFKRPRQTGTSVDLSKKDGGSRQGHSTSDAPPAVRLQQTVISEKSGTSTSALRREKTQRAAQWVRSMSTDNAGSSKVTSRSSISVVTAAMDSSKITSVQEETEAEHPSSDHIDLSSVAWDEHEEALAPFEKANPPP